jgi:hypothetical protein
LADRKPKYAAITGARLFQGEVLCGLPQIRQKLETINPDFGDSGLEKVDHDYAIVISQECDLENDYRCRLKKTGNQILDNVLFCPAYTIEDLKTRASSGSDWKRIQGNNDRRYHCIECAPAASDCLGLGLPAIGIDFKRYFTVPTAEVYKRIEIGQIKRRCHLICPYAEQLLLRFCNFHSRIGLVEDHDISLQVADVTYPSNPQTSSAAQPESPAAATTANESS